MKGRRTLTEEQKSYLRKVSYIFAGMNLVKSFDMNLAILEIIDNGYYDEVNREWLNNVVRDFYIKNK